MGGLFSGRSEYALTPTVEECFNLDVNKLSDALTPGYRGQVWWGDRDDPRSTIGLSTVPTSPGAGDGKAIAVRLEYTSTVRGESTDHDYRVPITYTECNFGGDRPWFRCPGAGCGERVGKLYAPPKGIFACRECHGLGYTSSRASGNPRRTLRLRYRRVLEKLDRHGDLRCPSDPTEHRRPDRPKGMHQSTYEELADELDRIAREWDRMFFAGLQKLKERSTVDTPLG